MARQAVRFAIGMVLSASAAVACAVGCLAQEQPGEASVVPPPQTGPLQTQSAQTQPVQTRPVQTRPGQTQPGQTQPGQTQPAGAEPDVTVIVREFRFTGNTVISDRELAGVVTEFTGRPLTSEMLEQARVAVTEHYIKKGYINSGAILPDQEVNDGGDVTFQIVEGRLNQINLTETRGKNKSGKPLPGRLNPNYVKSRIRRGASGALNIVRLNDQLELLRQDPNVRRINAELRPGLAPGESYLDVTVEEANPLQAGIRFSNSRPPSVGAEQVDLFGSHRNLTGNGDLFAVRYALTQGGFGDMHLAGADDFTIDYVIPVTPADTTVAVNYTRSNAPVVEESFQDLDISSETDSVSLTVRHPVYRRTRDLRSTEVAVSASLAYRQNYTFLLGDPFSFSPGVEDGRSVVTAIRLGQEFSTSGQHSAFSLRSTFSIGTTVFGATKSGTDDLADGQMLAWLGQAQYVRLIPKTDWRGVVRVAGQVSRDPLLPIEQFSIGGIDTLRGYRENQLVRDEGVAGSVEAYIPIIRGRGGVSVLELIPFFDIGYGRNINDEPPAETLSSVGVGLSFTPVKNVSGQVYYGYALNPVDVGPDKDLQDRGIHFTVSLFAF